MFLLRIARRCQPAAYAAREQVLKLILMAQSTREIARKLGIEQRTVKSYIARLMRKTGADNRVKLSISALNHVTVWQETERASVGSAAIASKDN